MTEGKEKSIGNCIQPNVYQNQFSVGLISFKNNTEHLKI